MVKGVTWDPIGKYMASQSDDKFLNVWRTSDWQLETQISEPFEECSGTTHVLRLEIFLNFCESSLFSVMLCKGW